MFAVHVSDMLPRTCHGPLLEKQYQLETVADAQLVEAGVRVMRSGRSGQRWHCYATLCPPRVPSGPA
jgi:hypothetical protein